MNLKLAFNMPDGSVIIIGAAAKEDLEKVVGRYEVVDGKLVFVGLTDDEYKSFVISQNAHKGVIPINAEDIVELPADWQHPDPEFRSAWTKKGIDFSYDMEKAREVTRKRLRNERAPLLAEKDIAAIRAMETGDKAAIAEIGEEKQRLRDITALPEIEAAQTIDELKAITTAKA